LPEGEELPKQERLRNKTVNEIIDTERDYVNDLNIIIDVCFVSFPHSSFIHSLFLVQEFVTPLRTSNMVSANGTNTNNNSIDVIVLYCRYSEDIFEC
jgi:hypothetical protein